LRFDLRASTRSRDAREGACAPPTRLDPRSLTGCADGLRLRRTGAFPYAPKIQPLSVAVYKLPISASAVAHETSSGRSERRKRGAMKPTGACMTPAGPARPGRLHRRQSQGALAPTERIAPRPLRHTPPVLRVMLCVDTTVRLGSGQTAARGGAPLESGQGAPSRTPVNRVPFSIC
jgi:hypothetical protein